MNSLLYLFFVVCVIIFSYYPNDTTLRANLADAYRICLAVVAITVTVVYTGFGSFIVKTKMASHGLNDQSSSIIKVSMMTVLSAISLLIQVIFLITESWSTVSYAGIICFYVFGELLCAFMIPTVLSIPKRDASTSSSQRSGTTVTHSSDSSKASSVRRQIRNLFTSFSAPSKSMQSRNSQSHSRDRNSRSQVTGNQAHQSSIMVSKARSEEMVSMGVAHQESTHTIDSGQ